MFFSWIWGRHLFMVKEGRLFSMDGAKIFCSHMVEARILFGLNPGPKYFFQKKTQPRPPCLRCMQYLWFGYIIRYGSVAFMVRAHLKDDRYWRLWTIHTTWTGHTGGYEPFTPHGRDILAVMVHSHHKDDRYWRLWFIHTTWTGHTGGYGSFTPHGRDILAVMVHSHHKDDRYWRLWFIHTTWTGHTGGYGSFTPQGR